MYVYICSRHYSEVKHKFETIDECKRQAWADLEYGTAYPLRVEKDGKKVMNTKQLIKAVHDIWMAEEDDK